jgi:uncharacterized protein (DUF58 family)
VLTRRGWVALLGSLALVVTGRLIGLVELYVLAACGIALPLLAMLSVRIPRVALSTERLLHPEKVHAGTDSRVELVVQNRSGRRLPVLTVRDPFDRGRRQARFLLASLADQEVARAAYRLPTQQRGIFQVGPLEVTNTDGFGLAQVTRPVAAATELTVYPRIDQIAAMPQTRGHDPLAGADHPTALGLSGEDFYGLREYQIGDDLRRVHWPSTARLDELMIRQHEMPWQGRATVLLDVRASVHTTESLELAVSAAASIVTACFRRGSLIRLVSTDGVDSGFAAGSDHVEALMERLAVIGRSRDDRLASVLAALRRAGNAGALAAIVTSEAPLGDLELLSRLQTRFGAVTLVLFDRSAYHPEARHAAERPVPAFGAVVKATAAEPFAAGWNRTFGPAAVGVTA